VQCLCRQAQHPEQGRSQALSAGFATTIRRNRKAHDHAGEHSNPDGFHEWRKRAKDLRYHLGLLGKAWPPVLGGCEQAAKHLEQRLGDDHNLVVLRNTVLKTPDHFGKPEQVKAILDVVDEHQRKLLHECEFLALGLYEDKPGHWRRRIERCWSALQ
jgi:CHAD domain-containing protein